MQPFQFEHECAGFNKKKLSHQFLFLLQFFFRKQFVELFDEKAREMNRVEAEYSECKLKLEAANRRLVDCDYKGKNIREWCHNLSENVNYFATNVHIKALMGRYNDIYERPITGLL